MSITVTQGDITQLTLDAIVNAANASLCGGGGVDGAIHRAAGPELLKYCRTLGGCHTGSAKITPGFNLKARFIIHTVGPVWYGGQRGESSLLASCYRNSLQLAETHKLNSIAFPAISCGAYGFPNDKACEIAVTTTHQFLSKSEADLHVQLVAFDNSLFQLLNKSLQAASG